MDFSKVIGDRVGEKHIYLTTVGRNTKKPHTVELWFAVVEGNVYLSHEGANTDWMKNILADDHVEFRIRDHRFRGRAKILENGESFEIGKNALYLKYYGKATKNKIDNWFSESKVIEISYD
jgi:deazaflavin-dependent oxidoreductase (nitroreductase family)